MIGTVDGPVFHDAVSTAGKTKDAEFVADVVSRCINKIGAENVVLVVTDNAANCVRAGEPLKCHVGLQSMYVNRMFRPSECMHLSMTFMIHKLWYIPSGILCSIVLLEVVWACVNVVLCGRRTPAR